MTTLATSAVLTSFELRSGPRTIAGPGETCLVCGDPLSAGEVYLFVAGDGQAGVAHEDCAECEAAAAENLGGDPAATNTAASAAAEEGCSL